MATTTNYGWTTPDDTALVKDGAAAIRSLGTAIDTTTYNNAQAAIAKTIVDAKGDLIVGTAADTVARLASSASNGNVLTVDTSTATGLAWAAPAGGGKVLQVVYGSTSTGVATASATYIDTGLTATITPSSTASKVLVITNHVECSKNGDTRMRMKLLRGATDILQLGQNTGNTNNSNFDNFFIGCSYLDSPATTSATTYKTQFNNQDATGNTQVTGNGTCVSTIILMEIGA